MTTYNLKTETKFKPAYCLAIATKDGGVYIDSAIKSEVSLSGILKDGDRIIKVKVEEHSKRSLTASGLLHIWIKQLSGFTGNDIITQKADLKMKFGYPILRQNEEIWPRLKLLFKGCDWHNLGHEEKVKMSEIIPCTSIMSTKELKLMMDTIKDWAMNQFNVELDNGKREG